MGLVLVGHAAAAIALWQVGDRVAPGLPVGAPIRGGRPQASRHLTA
jgi:hypothetical protein